jgi:3-oxoacyl-[acyl-carrier protein] reductase
MLYNKLMQKLKGKTVLITGSSQGIGAETAEAFAREGCNVVVTFLYSVSEAEQTVKKCKAAGAAEVVLVQLDIKSQTSIRAAVNSVSLKFGGIDVLVNNAGVIRWKKFDTQTEEDIEDQLHTNLEGLIKMTKTALPSIRDTIINIASGAGSHPVVDLSVYCATKYGVKGFTKVLALEQPGLNIYTVSPTMTATKMTDFHGMPASKVAEVIVQAAKDGYGKKSGADIKVWQVMAEAYQTTPWGRGD